MSKSKYIYEKVKGKGWYGDFRRVDGGQQALKPEGSSRSTLDRDEAVVLYGELLKALKSNPKCAPAAKPYGHRALTRRTRRALHSNWVTSTGQFVCEHEACCVQGLQSKPQRFGNQSGRFSISSIHGEPNERHNREGKEGENDEGIVTEHDFSRFETEADHRDQIEKVTRVKKVKTTKIAKIPAKKAKSATLPSAFPHRPLSVPGTGSEFFSRSGDGLGDARSTLNAD